jgi:hypothetical protein
MYCTIHEAWDDKNSISNLSKRYQENFNSFDDQLSTYKINENHLSYINEKPKIEERQDARYNNDKSIVFNEEILEKENNQTEDIQTEDIILSSEHTEKKSKTEECEELIKKVLSCDICRKMLEKKLNLDKNPFLNLINNEIREILILILIGLIIMIIIDLFIRISS